MTQPWLVSALWPLCASAMNASESVCVVRRGGGSHTTFCTPPATNTHRGWRSTRRGSAPCRPTGHCSHLAHAAPCSAVLMRDWCSLATPTSPAPLCVWHNTCLPPLVARYLLGTALGRWLLLSSDHAGDPINVCEPTQEVAMLEEAWLSSVELVEADPVLAASGAVKGRRRQPRRSSGRASRCGLTAVPRDSQGGRRWCDVSYISGVCARSGGAGGPAAAPVPAPHGHIAARTGTPKAPFKRASCPRWKN
jgi:hypothetical protein